MKTLLVLLGLSFFTAGTLNKNTEDDVIAALQAANSGKVVDYMDAMIDLKLPDNVNEITNIKKAQAGIKLGNFFEENGITGFELASKRKMGELLSITGKLVGKTQNYNLTIMLKEKAGKSSIITLRIS